MRLHLTIVAWLAAGAGPALAGTEQPMYAFQGGADGSFPEAGLIADANGNLFGTTTAGGTGSQGVVFELSPPAPGATGWTRTVLYAFTGAIDGGVPEGRLLMDKKGRLYGTTYQGGAAGQGVVFSLSPPHKKGPWAETVLYTFTGTADGGAPRCTLIGDRQGNLYGTTTQGGTGAAGTLFRLSPPVDGTIWIETVLYDFTGGADGATPYGSLVLGSDGGLYGTASGAGQYGYGTIYRMTPANEFSWTFQLLHAFQGGTDGSTPRDGMIAGSGGSFYGTTAGSDGGQGTVFQLTPPVSGGSWTETPVYAFTGQDASGTGSWATLSRDKTGTLYGTAVGQGQTPYGEIFSLTSKKGVWTATVLHAFQGGADGQFPYSTVLIGANGVLYGTAAGAAGQDGSSWGLVWNITSGALARR